MTDAPNQTEPPELWWSPVDDAVLRRFPDGTVQYDMRWANFGREVPSDARRLAPQDDESMAAEILRLHERLRAATAELSRLQAENGRLQNLVEIYEDQIGTDTETILAQARRDLEEAKAENEDLRGRLGPLLKAKVTAEGLWRRILGHYPPTEEQLSVLAQAGTGDTAQPGGDVAELADAVLHGSHMRWLGEKIGWGPLVPAERVRIVHALAAAGLLATRPDAQETDRA